MTKLRWWLPDHSILRTPSSTILILCKACKFWGPSAEEKWFRGIGSGDCPLAILDFSGHWTNRQSFCMDRVDRSLMVWRKRGCGGGCLETRGFIGDLLYILLRPVVLVSEKLQQHTKKRSVWIPHVVKNPGPAKMLEEVRGHVEWAVGKGAAVTDTGLTEVRSVTTMFYVTCFLSPSVFFELSYIDNTNVG